MRLVFAVMVLVDHAFALSSGAGAQEMMSRRLHSPLTLGILAVDGFFLLSGYLIVQSWMGDPELTNFLRKRLLRIVPGYFVAVLLSVIAVGSLVPGIPSFFSYLLHSRTFFASVLTLNAPITPPVFPTLHYQVVNGSMWTIAYEFRCYVLVALAGVCGILRRRALWLLAAIVLLALLKPVDVGGTARHELLFGTLSADVRLTGIFVFGGCFYLFRDRIPLRPLAAVAAFSGVLATIAVNPVHFELPMVLCGAYLLFFFAGATHGVQLLHGQFPDISYGMYLYGWPVQSLLLIVRPASPWFTLAGSVFVCVVLGWLSWHLVERPMLRLKRRATAALPPP
jgi:peptidoglycan/LPS O-acetylase OafA/YrhL